jgi:glycosyltransferase involved in cell wall biosynthesis
MPPYDRAKSGGEEQRVLFLLSDLGTGGTARATLHAVNGLANLGVGVSLVVLRSGGVLTPLVDERVRLRAVRKGRSRGAAMLLATPELIALVRSERPTVIVSSGNHMHVAAAVTHALVRRRTSKLALKMTNPVTRPGKGRLSNALRRSWYRWAFRLADRILLISEAARNELEARSPRLAPKLQVVDNPYVTDAMISAGEHRVPFRPGHLLAVGRLVEQKSYPLLLDALARISDLPWTIDILGDGPLLPALRGKAEALGIGERVNFRGYVTDPVSYFQSAHALVLASAWEGQGAVLLEALACGCPVIATRSTDAVAAVVDHGVYGTLTPPGDAVALADAIASELRQRSQLPSSTSEWVRRYGIEAGIKSHADALDLRIG